MCFNKGGDLLAAGLAEVLRATKLGRILLHERGIEAVLADQQAELVAEFRFAIAVGRLGRKLPYIRLGLAASGQGSDLLNGAHADPVRFPQGTIDRPGLGDSHLRPAHQRRHVGRIGIAITDKAFAAATFVDGSLEGPSGTLQVAELANGVDSDPGAVSSLGQPQEARVRDVPAAIQKL